MILHFINQEVVSFIYKLWEKLYSQSMTREESALMLPDLSILTQLLRKLNRNELQSIKEILERDSEKINELLNIFYSMVTFLYNGEFVASVSEWMRYGAETGGDMIVEQKSQ